MNIHVHLDRLNDRVFEALYSRALVYNACWEDPAIDRQVLDIHPGDTMVVIASAGCNVLDYALDDPGRIHAIDMNPRQTALLELKLAGIRALTFDDFFEIFGTGRHARFPTLYATTLRPQLSPFAQRYWDRHQGVFDVRQGVTGGLYFHGLSGKVARSFHLYLKCRRRLAHGVAALLETNTLSDQREAYDQLIAPHLWSESMNWVLSRQFTMSMLGVPHPQRREVENQHPDGVAGFIRGAIEYVFRQISMRINYFWRLYLTGAYTIECCPEYLKRENFSRLQNGLVDCIEPRTCSVTEMLNTAQERITKFVLLDHMDWMSSYLPRALTDEWQAIFASAADQARIIFRSAHQWPSYLESVRVNDGDRSYRITDRLRFYPERAAALQPLDRVHTYAGFHIADICA